METTFGTMLNGIFHLHAILPEDTVTIEYKAGFLGIAVVRNQPYGHTKSLRYIIKDHDFSNPQFLDLGSISKAERNELMVTASVAGLSYQDMSHFFGLASPTIASIIISRINEKRVLQTCPATTG